MEVSITIGIAGHVDHGKTTLVRALTGIDTDRMKEEKRRGLSIESGVAPLSLPSGSRVSLVDVPGHTNFMKNTIRGLSAVDIAVLVVAADDGVMPQTREHLDILRFFGIEKGFVVLSKTDIVDADTIELATLEVHDLTEGSFLENCPIIPFNGNTGAGREEIIKTLEDLVETTCSAKDFQKPFRLFIDQIRAFQGIGTVVSGTILSGILHQGDRTEIVPTGLISRVRSLERHHASRVCETAGSRVGINLQGVSSQKISRGMVLAHPGSLVAVRFLNAELSLSTFSRQSVRNGQWVKAYIGTVCTGALLVIMEGQRLNPGDTGLVQLRLNEPVGAINGDRFVITPLNTSLIIGGGRVLETTRLKFRKAHATRVVPYLKAVQNENLCGIVTTVTSLHSWKALSAEDLAQSTGIAPERFEKVLSQEESKGRFVSLGNGRYVPTRTLQKAKDDIVAFVEKTLREDTLKERVSAGGIIKALLPQGIEPDIMNLLLDELTSEHRLVTVNGGYSIDHIYREMSSVRERLVQQTLRAVQEVGPVPASVSTIWDCLDRKQGKKDILKILNRLSACGDIVRLGNERYLSRKGLDTVKNRVKNQIISRGSMTLADCTDVLGYGRTVGVSVLEYLDGIGYTLRCGNDRILKQ